MSREPVFEYHPKKHEISLIKPDGEKKWVEISPGWAFGTGEHPTTKLCIRMLEYLFGQKTPEMVLDVGCGSGVLAICAVSLGAKFAAGLDIESATVEEARANARRNGLASRIEFFSGTVGSAQGKYDLITANILANAILEISGHLHEKLLPGGSLLVSGIRKDQQLNVVAVFKKLGLSLESREFEQGWSALLFSKY